MISKKRPRFRPKTSPDPRWQGSPEPQAPPRQDESTAEPEERIEGGLIDLAYALDLPLVATNDVHAHEAARRPLQDVLWCVREHCTVDQAGFRLLANAERQAERRPGS